MTPRQLSILIALGALNLIVLCVLASVLLPRADTPASPTAAIALATPTVTPTLTETPEPAPVFPDIIPITRPVNTVFILDASGSMTSRIAGRPKMDIAKDVMTQLVEKLPVNIRAGIRVYGKNFGGTDAERPQSCQDIELLAPLGDPNKANLIARVRGITPRGWTPIYGSLLSAKDDFIAGQDNNVVLVSDGIETCGGDPCAAARQLRASGIALTIHVVGFDVDDATRTQLQCVANAASGRYYDAKNGQELANALNSAVNAVQLAAPSKVALLATATPTPTPLPLPTMTRTPLPVPTRTATRVPPTLTRIVTRVSQLAPSSFAGHWNIRNNGNGDCTADFTVSGNSISGTFCRKAMTHTQYGRLRGTITDTSDGSIVARGTFDIPGFQMGIDFNFVMHSGSINQFRGVWYFNSSEFCGWRDGSVPPTPCKETPQR